MQNKMKIYYIGIFKKKGHKKGFYEAGPVFMGCDASLIENKGIKLGWGGMRGKRSDILRNM